MVVYNSSIFSSMQPSDNSFRIHYSKSMIYRIRFFKMNHRSSIFYKAISFMQEHLNRLFQKPAMYTYSNFCKTNKNFMLKKGFYVAFNSTSLSVKCYLKVNLDIFNFISAKILKSNKTQCIIST